MQITNYPVLGSQIRNYSAYILYIHIYIHCSTYTQAWIKDWWEGGAQLGSHKSLVTCTRAMYAVLYLLSLNKTCVAVSVRPRSPMASDMPAAWYKVTSRGSIDQYSYSWACVRISKSQIIRRKHILAKDQLNLFLKRTTWIIPVTD